MMAGRRISYRPTWRNDLTAPVIGERSAFCEKRGLGSALDSRGPGRGPGGGPALPPLMGPRVIHCDLRDLEWAAVVGPAEWFGSPVVVVDEGDDAVGEVVDAGELAVAQQASLEDREEQLDLVEPRGVRRGVVQEDVWPFLQECFDRGSEVG